MEMFVVKNKDTGKYFSSKDKYKSTKHAQWTGTSIQDARIYKNIGHIKTSIGTYTKNDIKLPPGFCKKCNKQRDTTHKACFKCGYPLGGTVRKPVTRNIPSNIKVIEIILSKV